MIYTERERWHFFGRIGGTYYWHRADRPGARPKGRRIGQLWPKLDPASPYQGDTDAPSS